MIIGINRIMSALESRIFYYGLVLCAIFRLIRWINEFSTGQPELVLWLGVVNMVLLAGMIFLRRYKTVSFIALHFIFLVTTWFTWQSSGGYQGIIPYAFIAMMAFAIFTSHGTLLGITLATYAFHAIYLTQTYENDINYSEPLLVTQINYLACVFVLISLCLYAKNRFSRYREYIQSVNNRLDLSANTLSEQAKQLRVQGEQLQKLLSELETKILAKHLERDEKRAILSKYAYVNAHHVRGPLARILGLIALIEKERLPRDRRRNIEEIKSDALEIDGVVRKISEVLSD
ncbi:hypothetical protein WBG78_03515 [Chryseolinea sp. T2]|uniref:hypothetical protein n=1 Tax=Chryseolinea sp. T2 TaxID=3129255 RepID=UPI003077E52C